MFSFIKELDISHVNFDLKKHMNLIKYYLIECTNRKTNYLYLNIINARYQILLFTNAKNVVKAQELIRPGNPDVLVKLVKIKNKEHYNIIQRFFLMLIGIDYDNFNKDILNDIYVYKINDILSYLNKIKYIKDKMILSKNIFNTIYGEFAKKRKKLIYIEGDIFTFQKLYNFYVIYKSSQKSSKFEVIDIMPFQNDDSGEKYFEMMININNNKYLIPIIKHSHTLSKNMIKKLKDKKYSQHVKLIKHKEEGYYQYYTEIKTDDFDIISGFPNIKIIEKNLKRKE